MVKRYELTGKKVGNLTIIKFAKIDKWRSTYWLCRCVCGREIVVKGYKLQHDKAISCGCLNYLNFKDARKTHGLSRTPEYDIWCAIKKRCFNPSDPAYKYYGARGITICDKWRNSFESFIIDIGVRPQPKLSLDRINNDGNYEPGNVRWTTWHIQNSNKRNPKRRVAERGRK